MTNPGGTPREAHRAGRAVGSRRERTGAARRNHLATRPRWQRIIVTLLLAVSASAAVLPAAAPASAQSVAPARPIPAARKVSITDAGYLPAHVVVVTGQSVEFTNNSATVQTVRSTGATLVDSGPIPPGGGFTVSIGAPGWYEVATATAPGFGGSITVGQLAISGSPDVPVMGNLPTLALPPVIDPDEIPSMGIGSSRTRLLMAFVPGTTVAQANAAMAEAGVSLLGTIPSIGAVLVGIEDPGAGQFDPLFAAAAVLRANPFVLSAALDLERSLESVPGTTEAKLAGPPADDGSWTWEDDRFPDDGSGAGVGGNWGLEASRFPQAWNLLDQIRTRGNTIDTVVLDVAFTPHPDLPNTVKPLCNAAGLCNHEEPAGPDRFHATHVSGTIGASWGNPLSSEPGRLRGIDGANPVAHLYGAMVSGLHGSVLPGGPSIPGGQGPTWWSAPTTEAFTLALDGKTTNLWPNLRVMNISLGTIDYKRDPNGQAKWPRLMANKRCGPGADDDATGTGPCTPSTFDLLRKEIVYLSAFATLVAQRARQLDVTLVVSAGNEGGQMCILPDNSLRQPPCSPSQPPNIEDASLILDFGVASAAMGPGGANPIIIAEATNKLRERPRFSNIGGTVAAPGVAVLSTSFNGSYGLLSGTSMAAPHVTALVGYLLAYLPTLTPTEIRELLRSYGYGNVVSGTVPRIDAFNSILALPGAAEALVDVNDVSLDGNRRLVRNRDGTTTIDTNVGALQDGAQLHTAPDGRVDMRDFRRFRDAVLQACATDPTSVGVGDCPTTDQIDLNGPADHPKKDTNLDGCVAGQSPDCTQREDRFSRFDFNGDGTLELDHLARLPLVRDPVHGTGRAPTLARGDLFSDLSLLRAWFDADPSHTEGWTADQLRSLLSSADVEVHADALFRSGADYVDVTVTRDDGTAQPVPAQRISAPGQQIVITTPVDKAGETVSVTGVGHKADGSVVSRSFAERGALRPGGDARADLCVATVSAVPADPQQFAGSGGSTDVTVALQNCGRAVTAGVPLHLELAHRTDDLAPASTLSTTATTTDPTGRAVVRVQVGTEVELLNLRVKALIEVDPAHDGLEEITTTAGLDVQAAPRVVYRWKQVTDDFSDTKRHVMFDGHDHVTTYVPASDVPLVVERAGTLAPVGGGDARLTEVIGENRFSFLASTVDEDTGVSGHDTYDQLILPFDRRDTKRTALVSQLTQRVRDGDNGDTLVPAAWRPAATSIDVRADEVVVDRFRDLDSHAYEYAFDQTRDYTGACGGQDCIAFLPHFDQLELAERRFGSSLAYADDLSRPLTFRRNDDGTFGTYHWCSQPQTIAMAGGDRFADTNLLPGGRDITGSAHSRFEFVATVTTDSNLNPADLAFPPSCTAPAAPTAAIARDFVNATEGQVVGFLDASSDANGDITTWAWDFGDGTTSTAERPDHRYDDDGAYRVSLTVGDATGLTATTTLDITIANAAPEVSADDVQVDAGVPVAVDLRMFDPSERDQEALELTASWLEPDGPAYPTITTPGGSLLLGLGPQPAGVHHLRLLVADKDGAEVTTTITVTVGGPAAGVVVEPDAEAETQPAPACAFGVKLGTGEADAVALISQYRTGNGRTPIYASPTLTAAALAQARWLRDNDLFQHAGAGGSDVAARALAAAYPGHAVSENLARGTRTASGAFVAWKMSRPHDENMLGVGWRSVGIAKVDTTHGPLWVTVFGDKLDCPVEPPDFDRASNPPDPVIAPVGTPITEVLASPGTAVTDAPTVPERTAQPLDLVPAPTTSASAPPPVPTAATPAPVAAALPSAMVVAFTASSVHPTTGEVVTVTNRSGGTAQFDAGDGRPATPLTPGLSTLLSYLDPGTFVVRATAGDQQTTLDLVVDGASRPPVLAYTGPTNAPFGSRSELTAHLQTTAGAALTGRPVRFTIAGHDLDAVTDSDGNASVTLNPDVAVGPHPLVVEAPALTSGAGATATVTFTIGPNQPPTVDAHGPYDLLVGDALTLDSSGSFDPDGLPVSPPRWDLDDDGVFDDPLGDQVISADIVTTLVCGGSCTPGVDEHIQVQVVDAVGAETVAGAAVRFRRDFALSVAPANAVVNPGGSTSFAVNVSTTSGFTDGVQLSVPFLPAGVTASFVPTTVTPNGASIVTLTAANDAGAFDGGFTVRGSSAAIVHDATGTVQVEFGLVPICYGSADVHVVDAVTGAPVVGATVSFLGTTDADGRLHLDRLELGPGNTPVMRTFVSGDATYESSRVERLTACGVTTTVELALTPRRYGHLEGRVVVGIPDPNDHSATRAVTPTDIAVSPAGVGFGPFSGAAGDADGRFTLPPIELAGGFPKSDVLTVAATGYWTETSVAEVRTDSTTVVTQALVPICTADLDVRVLDEVTRLPLPGVRVTGSDAFTNGGGRVRIIGLPLGRRNSWVNAPVTATATVAGREISSSGYATLGGCGQVGQVDLLMRVPAADHASLRGRVTDSVTGDPVAGATVRIIGLAESVTDADGRYELLDMLIGYDGNDATSQRVVVSPPEPVEDWITSGASVLLVKDETVVLDLTLTRRQFAAVDVHVVDAATGEPVAGASVSSPPGADRQTDSVGTVHFGPIPTQNVPVDFGATASAPGYLSATGQTTLQPGATGDLVVPLARSCSSASIHGLVRNATTGAPLPGAFVSRSGGGSDRDTFTDADGRFTFTNIPIEQRGPTPIVLGAYKEGFIDAHRSVKVYCGASITVGFGDDGGLSTSLAGRVTRADDGAPVAGAVVGGEWGDATTTDADGHYSFPAVPLGAGNTERTWTVDAQPPVELTDELGAANLPVTLHAGQPATLDVALPAPRANGRPVAQSFGLTAPQGQISVPVTMAGTDPDGDPLTFRVVGQSEGTAVSWTYGSADAVYFLNSLPAGTFSYIASDGRLDSTPAEVVVTREGVPTNQGPVAVIAPVLPSAEGGVVSLDGSGSFDVDGTVVGYAWDLDGDGQHDDSTAVAPTLPAPDDANVVISLEVTDDQGAVGVATRQLIVTNVAPTVDAGPDVTLAADRQLARSGSFTDVPADTWTATVDWDEGAGAGPLALDGTTFLLAHTFALAGPHTVTVTVCDDDLGCTSDAVVVTVPAPPVNVAPTASVSGPTSVVEGSTITLDASGSSDADGAIVAFEWDLDGDGQHDDATGAQLVLAAPDDAVRVVSVQVRDDVGATALAALTITVTNAVPVVDAGADTTRSVGQAVDATVTFADPGDDTWTATVDWGDGTGPVAVAVVGKTVPLHHDITVVGTFPVTVEVCDDDGGCSTDAFVVTATSPPATSADLSLVKHHDGQLVAGGSAKYALSLTNAGPDAAAGPVTITDDLPTGMTFLSGTGDGWTCAAVLQAVTCTRLGPLGLGAAPPVQLTVVLAPTLADGATLTNEADATSASSDPDPADDHASDPGTVTVPPASADLRVHLATTPALTNAVDGSGAWTAAVTNDGPDAATGAEALVVLPPGVTDAIVAGDGWTCTGTTTRTCTGPNLPAGAGTTLQITGVVVGSGPLTVSVSADQADDDPENNRATLALAVPPPTTTTTTTTSTPSTTTPSTTTTSGPPPTGSTTTTSGSTTTTSTTPATTAGPSTTTSLIGSASTRAVGAAGREGNGALPAVAIGPASGTLPTTGTAPLVPLLIGLALVGLGSLLLTARRARAR